MRTWVVLAGLLFAGCSDPARSCSGTQAQQCCDQTPDSACMGTEGCHLVTSIPITGSCTNCTSGSTCQAATAPVAHSGPSCDTLDEAGCSHRDDCIPEYHTGNAVPNFYMCSPLFVPD